MWVSKSVLNVSFNQFRDLEMKNALTVLFVLAMVVCSTQTVRHVYVKFLDSNESVLDEFRTDTESDIANAGSLQDLVGLYRSAQKEIDLYESDPSNPVIEPNKRRGVVPYTTKVKIKKEIQNREHDQNQLNKLWFYWGCGLVSLILGVTALRYGSRWLGFSIMVTGFSEMLAWTSPLFHNRLLSLQFEQLLDYKLLLSAVTWLLLVSVWMLIEKRGLPIPKS